MKTDDADIEQQIMDWFEANYETMKSESGQALSPDVKEAAKQQVLFYWKKLRHIAESITETEVHLSLPQQKTPANRTFNIEGVVDIIRKGDTTEMYDIKTHDAATVCKNRAFYEEQLNVYAHIWQNLQGEHLGLAAIIATKLPSDLHDAIHNNDTKAEERAFSEWDPISSCLPVFPSSACLCFKRTRWFPGHLCYPYLPQL